MESPSTFQMPMCGAAAHFPRIAAQVIDWNGNERHYPDASATREFGQHFIPMPMLEISSVSGTIEQGGRLLRGTYDMVIALNLIYERKVERYRDSR